MDPTSPTPPPTPRRTVPLEALAVPRDGRGMLVGTTGCGKSTCAEWLIERWRREHGRKARILIVDSKPRFRADRRLDGWSAARKYRKWRRGEVVKGSILLQLRHQRELEQVWREHGSSVAIAQGTTADIPSFRWIISRYFDMADDRNANLLYVDEVADFYGVTGVAPPGDPILQVARSGREKGVALLAATQRPKGVPISLFTELSQLYYWGTPFSQDWERLREMGLGEEINRAPLHDHAFYFTSHSRPDMTGYYRLDIPQPAARRSRIPMRGPWRRPAA